MSTQPAISEEAEGEREHRSWLADYGRWRVEHLRVLALLAQGLSNKEIAERLFVSVATVKYHVRVLFSKLGASSRAEAVALAWQHNLIEE